MTHPFHPFHGREFDVIEILPVMGVGLIHYTADDGELGRIPQGFTSAAAVDPFVKVSAGRSAFRVSELLELAALLDVLDGDDGAPEAGAGGARAVKEIMPHV